ncbi:RcnB family protein [Brevundimonas sp. SORGH_AS_0993]|uniref:RcnB family protein n=1 Tax=Brevundimonas sp. SORGH_AS_0993 TaxID=3041794 RepID=UPI00278A23F7|nr:RcnB family protein [Brevundimonas sp. SORGH_AS_0993]MDQ1153234.1 Ni/Co efflux regulator RcnB [Brevundimonas sp. SORGH_AS_0993]
MKRLLMAFTAIAAVAGPLATALPAFAQEEPAPRERPARERGVRPEIRDADAPTMTERARPPRPERADADVARRERPNRPDGWGRPDQNRPDQSRLERPRLERPDRPEGWNRPDQPRPERPERPEDWTRPDRPLQVQPGPNGPERPGAAGPERPDQDLSRPGRPGSGWNRPDRPETGWNRPDRPAIRPGPPDRHGADRRPDRDRRHEEFRRRFDSDQWRRDFYRDHRSDWWRNDHRFRDYNGVRFGFYFAPGWGYYSVPRSYWGRSWSVGQYLPDVFWRYQLNDWRTYGLGYPPVGTRWVSVDNTIYLIDDFDGYIIDVIRDAWRW